MCTILDYDNSYYSSINYVFWVHIISYITLILLLMFYCSTGITITITIFSSFPPSSSIYQQKLQSSPGRFSTSIPREGCEELRGVRIPKYIQRIDEFDFLKFVHKLKRPSLNMDQSSLSLINVPFLMAHY